ncbi:hypothetical protein BC936DRAFT_139408 [Jimgerdemannia flammicorona]|uniref:Uncharacterized protein n=1 Tax=Jimgerdemannia flammicorona TaxID=994334 RepID=A0A433B9Y3_9FUNG|nr:hypothetical protein BC936DRAFT_139408 [Jimgerdemannia flammicorona]
MKIVKLHLADYATHRPFCLFHFPLPVTPPLLSPSQQQTDAQAPASPTSFVTFYKLADIDVIFCDAAPGHLYHSGEIPAPYLESAGYFIRDQTGDAYLAAKALSEVAEKLGNYLLADFCKLTKDEILSGAADKLLSKIPVLRRVQFLKETEEEFEPVRPDRRSETQLSSPPPASHPIVKREPRSPSPSAVMTISPPPEPQGQVEHARPASGVGEHIRREMSGDGEEPSPTVTPRKRPASSNPMAINQVLSAPESGSMARPHSASPPMQRDHGAMSDGEHRSPNIKQENGQPVSVYSAPSPPPNMSSSPPGSPTFGSTSNLDDDPRNQKRRRVVPPLAGSVKTANNSDLMEHVRNNLKLKQQQKAITESSRQYHAQQQQPQPSTPTSATPGGPQAILPKPVNGTNGSASSSAQQQQQKGAPAPATPSLLSKKIISPRHKNARNLTIFTPSYTEQHAVGIRSAPLVPTHQQITNTRAMNGPVTSQSLLHSHQSQTLAPLLSPRAPLPPNKKIAPRTTMAQESSSRFGPNTPLHPLAAYTPTSSSMPATSPRTTEFHPVTSTSFPPVTVVPSQNFQHPQPSPSFYQSHHALPSSSAQLAPASTPVVSSMSALPLPTPSTTTTFSSLPKQTFLQPFENLFDNIETTRTLKSTLDDQIRRSSALMQTLQASATMIEGLVRNHFKDMQKEMLEKFDKKVEDLTKRLAALEEREQRKEREPESDRVRAHQFHHHQQQYQHTQDKSSSTRSSPSTPNAAAGHHAHHLHYVPASPYASSPKTASFATSMSSSYSHSQQQVGPLPSPLPSMPAPAPSAFTPTQSAFHRHQSDAPNGNTSSSPTTISNMTSRASPVHGSNTQDQHGHPIQGATVRQPPLSASSSSSTSARLSKSPPEPPTIVRSQDDIKRRDYENVLRGLQDRLDGLERRFDS